jgi:type I restriction enzyme S subunit
MAALVDVADLIMGQSPPSVTYNEVGDGLAFFQGKSDFGGRHPTPKLYCSAPLKIAKPRDILISVRAPVGPTNIADRECCIGRGLAAIRSRDIDADFLYFNLRYIEKFIASLGSGSTFHAINKSQLASVEVNPRDFSLTEQRKIAAVLGLVQRAIEQQERVIALTTELKKALLQKLFTEGLRGEPQKRTEIGPAPETWELMTLGSLAKIGNGSTPKRSNAGYWKDGAIPWLNSTKIHELFISKADQFVTDLAVRECHLPQVKPGSLLIAITGQGKTLGNSALVLFETCINQHLAYAQFSTTKVLPEFVLWFMQTRYDHLRSVSQAGGSTKGALTCGYLKSYPIVVPSLEEQREIANVFNAVDKKQKVHKQKDAILTDLFHTLLHQLMTAQIRVNDLDLDEILQQPVAEFEGETVNPPIVGNGRDRSLHEGSANK